VDASLKDYLSGLPTRKGSVWYGGRVGGLGGAVWGGSKWAGLRRGLYLLVRGQVQKRVGSVKEQARSMGAAELSVYSGMIDMQSQLKAIIRRLTELEAKVNVTWDAHQLAHGETE
jgi:hypothetical protein